MDRIRQLVDKVAAAEQQAETLRQSNAALTHKMCHTTLITDNLKSEKRAVVTSF
jgi:hypothetical protein